MKPVHELKILEVGEFSLFKRNLPDRTTLIFTGQNPARAADLDCRCALCGIENTDLPSR